MNFLDYVSTRLALVKARATIDARLQVHNEKYVESYIEADEYGVRKHRYHADRLTKLRDKMLSCTEAVRETWQVPAECQHFLQATPEDFDEFENSLEPSVRRS